MKNNSLFVKLTSALLAFLFIMSPFAPVFAAENRGAANGSTPPADFDSANVPVSSDTLNSIDTASSDKNLAGAEIDLAAPEKSSLKNSKDKIKDKAGDAVMTQAMSSFVTPGPSSSLFASNDPRNSDKARLPQSEALTGALIYDYPISIPSGRNNLQPDLKISYNNQAGEEGSVAGYGWSINIPFIERINRKGTDKLYIENYYNSSLSGELVSLGGTAYGAKVDNGEFLKYEFLNNSWFVTDKQGTKYKFGASAAARQDNPADSAKVFKWMLEEIRDTNDNFVRYEYFKDAGQIYPSKIFYTGLGVIDGIFEVEFLRESRTDAATLYKTGFSVKTNYRISEIQTKINGIWNKKYSLMYTFGGNGRRSILEKIIESGKDELDNIETLPAIVFKYQVSADSWSYQSSDKWKSPVDLSKGIIITDVNSDGFADIMQAYSSTGLNESAYGTYLNDGNGGWIKSEALNPPATFFTNYMDDRYSDGVLSADINSDGYTDLVHSYHNGSNYQVSVKHINNGSGWSIEPIDDTISFPLFGYRYPTESVGGAQFLDLNGDGLPDVINAYTYVYSNPSYLVSKALLNNGNKSWTDIGHKWSSPVDLRKGVMIVDVNGDGLSDIMRAYQSSSSNPGSEYGTYLNDGNGGWIKSEAYLSPATFYVDNTSISAYSYDTGVRAADVNGDGLMDLIQYMNNGSSSVERIFINTGNGWVNKSLNSEMVLLSNGNRQSEPIGAYIVDLNGDGLPDGIEAHRSTDYPYLVVGSVVINNGPKADLLSSITYSQGGKTDISYKATPKYTNASTLLNPNLPFVIDTVEKIITSDGAGNTSQTSYSYEGGKYYYADAFNRKFSGFAKVAATDAVGNVTKTYFHQGDTTNAAQGEESDHISKIGKVYRTESFDSAGNPYSKTISKWENYNLGNNRNFVKLTQKIEQSYDGNSTHRDKAETYAYDNTNGNLTEKIQWGEVIGTDDGTFTDIGTDKFITTISYASNPTLNVIGLVSQETTFDQNSAKIKESKYYYDNLALGSAEKGNQTKEEKWKSGTDYINAQKTYNSYGLVTQETDPRGKITSYIYDSYNLYPVTITNALNQSTQYAYDYSAGKPKQTTDPNGYIFQTVFDGLDRVLEEKQPDLTAPSTLVTKSAYIYTDTANAVSVKKTDYLDAAISVDSYSYFDGLGRIIQTRKEAEDANNFSVKDFIYNNRGSLEKESLPYFGSGSAKTIPSAVEGLYSVYAYDPLSRITSTANAVGTITNAYDDWKVTTTDAKGVAKDLYKDAYGNLIQVDEHGSTTLTTSYNYNSAGNLTKITDALGNIRNFTYDGLGRRLTAEDLHSAGDATFGTWNYSYDASGNLISQNDPKNQTVDYTYDDLNRQLTEDYTGAAGTEKTYAYDTCLNGIGKLCSITTSDYTESKEYNALGGVSKEIKNIKIEGGLDITNDGVIEYPDFNHDGLVDATDKRFFINIYGKSCSTENCGFDLNNDGILEYPDFNHDKIINIADISLLYNVVTSGMPIGAVTFTTQYLFDRQGNQILITNPDNSQIKNIYNSSGQLEQVQRKESANTDFANIVSDFDYSPLEKITYQADANGTATTNTYDAAKLYRLTSKVTAITGGSHAQDLAYTYDANGNITKIIDSSATNSAKTVDYTYDSLNRLLTAISTNAANGQNYSETYTYDAIGNIISKNGQTYTYSQTGKTNPHAVTSIGATNYTYDDIGNLLSDGNLTNIWDYNNRISQSAIGSTIIAYTYDTNGQRIKYSTVAETTIYLNKYYNVGVTIPTKHIFAGDQLIGTIKGTGANAVAYAVAADHLTGSNVITNSSGAMEELMDYYPYGGIRLDEKVGSFSEQRKFGGHEYDSDTGLSYMNARYYSGDTGRFVSIDPAFLAVGNDEELQAKTNLFLQAYLSDPQAMNSYSYARNNPLVVIDKTGNYIETAFDMAMFSLSVRDFREKPGFWNGVSVLADGASLFLPIPAIVGAVRHGDEAAKFLRGINRADNAADAARSGLDTTKVFYRGGDNLKARIGVDFKVKDGLVQTDRGVSINTDPVGLGKYGGAYKITNLPEGLQIKQVGKNISHFEITPAKPMTPEKYQGLLNKVKLEPIK